MSRRRTTLFRDLARAFELGHYADATVRVPHAALQVTDARDEETVIRVHRVVLAMQCPALLAVLDSVAADSNSLSQTIGNVASRDARRAGEADRGVYAQAGGPVS